MTRRLYGLVDLVLTQAAQWRLRSWRSWAGEWPDRTNLRQCLDYAVLGLDAEVRIAFLLHRLDDMPYEQIAERLSLQSAMSGPVIDVIGR